MKEQLKLSAPRDDIIISLPQIECQGRMEKLAVEDLSPHAGLYRDKFSVLGNEVLQVPYIVTMSN